MLEALVVDDIRKTIGKNIRHLRESRGVSQKHLAEKMGVRPNTMSGYESGNREPDAGTILNIADFFGVSIDYIYGKADGSAVTKQPNASRFTNEQKEKIISAMKQYLDEFEFTEDGTAPRATKKEYKVEDYISPDANSFDYDALVDLRTFMREEGLQHMDFAAYDMNDIATLPPKEIAKIKINLLKARDRQRKQ